MSGMEFEDLVGFGIQGLLEAARRCDRAQGAAFSTFAYYRVRGAMFDGVRSMGWLPRSEYARVRFEERASRTWRSWAAARPGSGRGRGRRPGPAVPEQDIAELANALHGVAAIFITLLSKAARGHAAGRASCGPRAAGRRGLARRMRRVLRTLPDKERQLIELYYFGDQTLEQVGARLGLSKSWASRLHARAMALLCARAFGAASPGRGPSGRRGKAG